MMMKQISRWNLPRKSQVGKKNISTQSLWQSKRELPAGDRSSNRSSIPIVPDRLAPALSFLLPPQRPLMDTSGSLIHNAGSDPQSEAWFRFFDVYEPLIAGWARRCGVNQSEVPDITQEVLKTVVAELKEFKHNGRPGAFRNWLKLITVNRCRRYWEQKKRRPNTKQTEDRESGTNVLDQLEDPSSDLSKLWDREHERHTLTRILKAVENDFDPATIEIFSRNVLADELPGDIAKDLDIPVGRIYKAKFRVMNRLQQEATRLIDDVIG